MLNSSYKHSFWTRGKKQKVWNHSMIFLSSGSNHGKKLEMRYALSWPFVPFLGRLPRMSCKPASDTFQPCPSLQQSLFITACPEDTPLEPSQFQGFSRGQKRGKGRGKWGGGCRIGCGTVRLNLLRCNTNGILGPSYTMQTQTDIAVLACCSVPWNISQHHRFILHYHN